MIERKAYDGAAEVKNADEGKAHLVISVFGNEDSDGDVMERGAFARDIEAGKAAGRLPKGVWAHDWKTPVALTEDAWEDEKGLNVLAQFAMWKQAGQDAFADIKHGLINEYSFGFKVRDAERKESRRHIKDVAWFEWSPVLIGANRDTHTVAVKDGSEPPSDTAALARVAAILKAGTLLPGQVQALLGLETSSPAGLTFEDHSAKVLAALGELTARAGEIRDLRAKEGRALSSARRERLRSVYDGLQQMTELLEALLTETDPSSPPAVNDAMQQFARLQAQIARSRGVNL